MNRGRGEDVGEEGNGSRGHEGWNKWGRKRRKERVWLATSSFEGASFAGAVGSELVIDDLELIYE